MRALLAIAALTALTLPALAQQQPRAASPQPAPRPPAQAQAAPPPAPPALFPCRTATEVCHVGVVTNNQVTVLFTNADKAEGIESKPIDALAADGSKLDLARHEGQVVMLTGEYDAKAGLTKAELVEAASPLVSFAIKVLLSGDEGEEEEQPQAPAPAPGGARPGAQAPAAQPAPRR